MEESHMATQAERENCGAKNAIQFLGAQKLGRVKKRGFSIQCSEKALPNLDFRLLPPKL